MSIDACVHNDAWTVYTGTRTTIVRDRTIPAAGIPAGIVSTGSTSYYGTRRTTIKYTGYK